jgi:uncharacterized membrane-anchored protein
MPIASDNRREPLNDCKSPSAAVAAKLLYYHTKDMNISQINFIIQTCWAAQPKPIVLDTFVSAKRKFRENLEQPLVCLFCPLE